MHGQNHEEQAWLQAIRFLIFPLLFSTNFASEVPGVSWNTPTSDDIYVPGDTISVSWLVTLPFVKRKGLIDSNLGNHPKPYLHLRLCYVWMMETVTTGSNVGSQCGLLC